MTDDKKFDLENPAEETLEAEMENDASAELDALTHEDGLETPFGAASGAGRPIAYIRPVSKQEVEGALPPGAPEGPYFALHDAEGRPLALFSDADAAWAAARANNLETVSLH